jgi:hypothetical protein
VCATYFGVAATVVPCDAQHAKVLSKPSMKEASGKFRKKHPKLPAALSDYNINRQVVLTCQQSGGGARIAFMFGGLLSISLEALSGSTVLLKSKSLSAKPRYY